MKNETVAVGEIPKDQKFSFCITPLPGRLLDLAVTGKSIAALAELHAAIGEEIDPKVKWKSCITGCGIEKDGTFRVDIVIVPIEEKSGA